MAAVLAQVIWQAPALAPIAVALVALVAAAVLWLYPPQTHGVPGGWRWVLPGLRALAVAAIAAAVVQPVVLRPRTTAREGAIVVLADRSHSMSVVDRDRSPAELVSLAAGLGALPPGVRTEPVPGLRAQLESIRNLTEQVARARGEAEYARLSGHGAPAATVRLRNVLDRLAAALRDLPAPAAPVAPDLAREAEALKKLPPRPDDASLQSVRRAADAAAAALARAQARADEQLLAQSEAVQKTCARLARLPREALLEIGLTQQPAGVLPNLPAGVPVYGFSFADSGDLRPVPAIVAGRTDSLNLQPSGARSDLAGAIRAAYQRMGTRPVQAMLVLSDGRQIGGDAEGATSDAAAAGAPIFAVESAAPGPRRDISITAFDVPPAARAGQTIIARVTVRATGYRGEPVEVRVQADAVTFYATVTPADDPAGGGGAGAAAAAAGGGGAQTATAEFEITLPRGGPQQLVASVLPRKGEVTDENNRAVRWVRVGGASAKVLVVAGPNAGRQYASLHAALSRTPWVALREAEEDEADGLTPRAILDQDVIILCDVPLGELGAAQWTAVEQSARQRGASVIVCAGRDAPDGYAEDDVAKLLVPYDPQAQPAWQNWPGGELQFRLAAAGDLPAGAEFLRHLQPVSRVLPLSVTRADAHPLVVERASGRPILTETRRGIGHVYFLGTDQSWRWRGQPGAASAADRDQFWPQFVRLVAPEPYAANEQNLWLDATELAPQPEESVTFRARVLDAYGEPADAPTQTVHVLQEGQLVRDVALNALADRSGRYEGSISGLPTGEYELRLDPPEDPTAELPPDPVRLALRVATSYEAEMADVSADPRLLRRVADATGGQFLPLDQLNTLPMRLSEIRQRQSRLVEYPLWDSPYLFAFVVACLSAEWSLRKKFALA